MARVLSSQISTHGSPYAYYTVDLTYQNRKEATVDVYYEITSRLQYDESYLGYALTGYLTVGGTQSPGISIKGTEMWSGKGTHVVKGFFTVKGLNASTESLSVSFKVISSAPGSASGLNSKACNSLGVSIYAKATTPTFSVNAIELGNNMAISLSSRLMETYRHTLEWSIGEASGIIATETSLTSVVFTPPIGDIASQITESMLGSVVITCHTYNSSGDLVGTESENLSVKIPSSIVPSVAAINVSEAVVNIKSLFGAYMKSLTRLAISVSGTGIYGSKIESYSTIVDGVTYLGKEFTSNALKSSGQLEIKTTVTDSRGQTGTSSIYIDVTDYTYPFVDIELITSENRAKIIVSGIVASANGLNSKSLVIKYKSMDQEEYTDYPVTLGTDEWTFTKEINVLEISGDATYEFVAVLSDKYTYDEDIAMTGVTVISRLAGGKGIAFLKEAKLEGVWANELRIDATKEQVNELSELIGADTDLVSFLKALSHNVGRIADYVKSTGTKNGWLYINWASGKCEIIGEPTLTFPETTQISTYSHRSIVSLDLRDFFTEVIGGICGYLNSDIHPQVSRHGTNKYVAQVDFVRATPHTGFTDKIPLCIVGKWK